MAHLLGQVDPQAIDKVTNSELAKSAPYMVLMIILVGIFLLFLFYWDRRVQERDKEQRATYKEMADACHLTHKETVDKVTEAIKQNTEVVAKNTVILEQTRHTIELCRIRDSK